MKGELQENMELFLFFSCLLPISILFLGVSIIISAIFFLRNDKTASAIRNNTSELKRGTDELQKAADELRKDTATLSQRNNELKEEVQKLYTALRHMCWWIPKR